MSAIVKARRGVPAYADVSAGAAIRSPTWLAACDTANWIRGKSKTLIPLSRCRASLSASAGANFYFRAKPHVTGLRRKWTVIVNGTGRVQSLYDSIWHSFSSITESSFSFYEDVTSATSTEYQAGIRVEALGATSCTVAAAGLEEVQRAVLGLDSTDLGTDLNTEVFREPIRADSNTGIYGVAAVATDSSSVFSRGLFGWATNNDTTGSAFSTTAGPTNVFQLDVPILVPKLYSGDTTGTASWRALCITSASGVSADVQVTNNSTATTTTIAVPTSSHSAWAWYPSTAGAPSTFSVDCTDVSDDDGLQGGAFNDLTFSVTRTGGAGTIYVAGISVFF